MYPPLKNDTVLRERYKLTEKVGQGGMGNVYRAEDLRLPGRLCAIKEIQIDYTVSAEARKQSQDQFLREASILAQVDHPNLPKVSDFFTKEDREYLVMDFVPGKDLKQIIDEQRNKKEFLPQETVLNWAAQIINALAYLHSRPQPVLHRDIKPANIKLTPDNRIKLVDFGLVKLLEPGDRTITVLQGRGTPLYTPLEQYGGDGGHTTVHSDIYAIGATLYHLLANRPPPEAKVRFLSPHTLRPLDEVNETVDAQVSKAILWALEMHPDDRPVDIEQFEKALLQGEQVPEKSGEGVSAEATILNALQKNAALFTVVLLLFIVALILTLT